VYDGSWPAPTAELPAIDGGHAIHSGRRRLGFRAPHFDSLARKTSAGDARRYRPWHFLSFLPEPHGHGSLRPTKTGDIFMVKVLEVDLARTRIALTMKLDAKPPAHGTKDVHGANSCQPAGRGERGPAATRPSAPQGQGATTAAFAKLRTQRP
jgi:hypothetical protein